MSALLLFVLPLACTQVPTSEPAVETTKSETPPAEYIYDDDTVPTPQLSTADLEGAITEAIGVFYTLSATPVFPAYYAVMAGAEEGCPSYYEQDGSEYWYDQCTSSSGTEFNGYGFYQDYDGYDAGD